MVKSRSLLDLEITPVINKKRKRQHKWTEANRKVFFEKCVPARKASIEKKRLQKIALLSQPKVDENQQIVPEIPPLPAQVNVTLETPSSN
jgi:hypothetical protein